MKKILKRNIAVILCIAMVGVSMPTGVTRAEEAFPASETEQQEGLDAFNETLPDVSEELPSSTKNLPDVSEELPSSTENLPDVSGELPSSTEDLPDVSEIAEDRSTDAPEVCGEYSLNSSEVSEDEPVDVAIIPEENETEIQEESVPDESGFIDEIAVEEITELATTPKMMADEESQERSGTCGLDGAPVVWRFQDGVLTVSGNGAMDDFITYADWSTGEILSAHDAPWKDFSSEILEVVIEEGVTRIGYAAFASCKKLKKVTIASSVTYIRHDAFANDFSLEEVVMGSGVEKMEKDIFWGAKITSLTLPASFKEMSESAFVGLRELQNIYVEEGNSVFQSIDGVLFKDGGKTLDYFPTGRTGSYRVPEGTVKISNSAFSTCSLTELIISDSVTEMGEFAVSNSGNLMSIVFPKNIKVIPGGVCYYSTALSSVVIPEGVEEIHGSAFYGCKMLANIVLPSTVKAIEAGAFPKTTVVTNQNTGLTAQDDGSYIEGVKIPLVCNAKYQEAFEVLRLVNEERSKAGVGALTMDDSLLETAMLRAAEIVLHWAHERPTGSTCFSANSRMSGENIACGSTTAQGVMEQWMKSPGHRDNILLSNFKSIGIGCVEVNGYYYWVQCFGYYDAQETTAELWPDKEQRWDILVKKDPKYYKAEFELDKESLKIGETCEVNVLWGSMKLNSPGIVIESSNPSVCAVENGALRATGIGTAEITVYFNEYREAALTRTVQVTKGIKVKVTYNANGGKVKEKNAEVLYESTFGSMAEPYRKGYAFLGWYTAKSGGKKVTSSTTVNSKKSMTLYAHWKKITVGRASVKKLKNVKGKRLKVTLKSVSGADGYQILYALNAKFTKAKRKAFITEKTKKISGLKKGKTYYVKARAYKIDSTGAKVFGAFSKVKKIKYKAKK